VSNKLAKRESALSVVPTVAEIEALADADLWTLAERADRIGELAWEEIDQRLSRWVAEGQTQGQMAERIGRSQPTVSRRLRLLGLETARAGVGGRPSIQVNTPGPDDDYEEVDAEVVDDEPARPRRRTPSSGAAHYLPDLAADDVEENLRAQALLWFERGAVVKELLDKRRPMTPRSDEDRKAIRKEATLMERVAKRLKESA